MKYVAFNWPALGVECALSMRIVCIHPLHVLGRGACSLCFHSTEWFKRTWCRIFETHTAHEHHHNSCLWREASVCACAFTSWRLAAHQLRPTPQTTERSTHVWWTHCMVLVSSQNTCDATTTDTSQPDSHLNNSVLARCTSLWNKLPACVFRRGNGCWTFQAITNVKCSWIMVFYCSNTRAVNKPQSLNIWN